MGFLKRLKQMLGQGVSAGSRPDDIGLYFYVKSAATGNIYKLRINPHNDLSQEDSGKGYIVRKVVVGKPGYDRMDVELHFNEGRKLIHSTVKGGELVDEAQYQSRPNLDTV
ncbi:MAG: hypothetical protein IAE83_16430 [Anaerolinea sp.]|nr:hypothetical protein [Anaerolinea sp.]MCC6975080.1 hypothetical protein [Anaerolineae bacterium]